MLCDFFVAMVNSIRLLRLKSVPGSFTKLAHKIESLTDRYNSFPFAVWYLVCDFVDHFVYLKCLCCSFVCLLVGGLPCGIWLN